MIYNIWMFHPEDGPFIWSALTHKNSAITEAIRVFELYEGNRTVRVEDINGNLVFDPKEEMRKRARKQMKRWLANGMVEYDAVSPARYVHITQKEPSKDLFKEAVFALDGFIWTVEKFYWRGRVHYKTVAVISARL